MIRPSLTTLNGEVYEKYFKGIDKPNKNSNFQLILYQSITLFSRYFHICQTMCKLQM